MRQPDIKQSPENQKEKRIEEKRRKAKTALEEMREATRKTRSKDEQSNIREVMIQIKQNN